MNKKIAFIITYTNEYICKDRINYINNLYVPDGYVVDIIKIKKEKGINIIEKYNDIIQKNNAKFKVYLDENITIVNNNFINSILGIFENNKKIGIIGVKGSKKLPSSTCFEDSCEKYGKVFTCVEGSMKCEAYIEISDDYESVQAVYGGIMITQYDILWRSDTFTSLHFSSLAQCLEFESCGYKTVVPKQIDPWCIEDLKKNTDREYYDFEKEKFLKEYSKKVFPLVSILIPTYNRPEYFELALRSAINQTYKNIEIIIGDDSTDEETEILMSYYLNNYENIKYYHNEENLGQFKNDIKLYNMAEGKFINYLMDDDLFEERKIEKMMNYFVQDVNEEISIVTSHRAIINEDGKQIKVFGEMDKYIKETSIISGFNIGNFMLKANCKCIGEPTTAMFRKNKLKEPFGVLNERKYGCNVDQASWFNLLQQGKCVYIAEVLSYFRIHKEQQQNSNNMKLLGVLDYSHSVLTLRTKGFLQNEEECVKALKKVNQYCKLVYCEIKSSDGDGEFIEGLKQLKENLNMIQNELSILLNKKDSLPLVSILIPAYNQTNYLKEALESAIKQTYDNIEIIIGDDSTNTEVEEFIKPYLEVFSNIKYFRNERLNIENDFGYSNTVNCFKKSSGEYVNFLLHDDLFSVEKIDKMMKYMLRDTNIKLVTSKRERIDSKGNILSGGANDIFKFDGDKQFNGKEAIKFILRNCNNFIGELTTVLFRRDAIKDEEINCLNKIRLAGIGDVANWISILKNSNMIFISEVLSYFRTYDEQNSKNNNVQIQGINSWYKAIKFSYEDGLIETDKEYKENVYNWIRKFIYVLDLKEKCIIEDWIIEDFKKNIYEALEIL